MIQQTPEYKNPNFVRIYTSTSRGHRLIGDSVMTADSDSTTVSRKPIVEVPEGVLPEVCDIVTARSTLAGMVLEGDLLPDELEALLSVYRKWDDVAVGEWIEKDDLLVYGSTLYRVNQGHWKQANWIPGEAESLYTKAVPDNVIPVWTQPTGSHDVYHVGDFVQYPEGTVWECTAGDASGSNSWEPGVYGWTRRPELDG